MGIDPEEEWQYWDKKAVELHRAERDTVASAAAKWTALQTAILGVFSAIAFAGGLTTLDKLADPWHRIALVTTIVAAFFAVCSLILLNLAGGGLRTRVVRYPLDGEKVKELVKSEAEKNNRRLTIGQWLSAVTLVLFVFGSFLVLFAGPTETNYVATFADRPPIYGVMKVAEDGTITVDGHVLDKSLVSLSPVAPTHR